MATKPGGSRTDTVVKLVLVFFFALLSFSVGTFVGKRVSDSEYRRAALEEDYKQFRQTASLDHGPEHSEQKKDGLSDKEIASLTEEFVQKEKHAMTETKTEPTVVKHSDKPHDSHAKKVDAPEKVATRISKGKAPVKDAKARKPTSILPNVAATAVGKYTVQVASYPDEAEARAHARELKGKGWSAFYMTATVNGKAWYRVSLGLFNNQNGATKHRTKLVKDGVVADAIIRKIIQ